MLNEPMLTVSVGESRRSARWVEQSISWRDLADRLKQPVRTAETADEFAAMSRDKRADTKDVGGFVGGSIPDGVRKAGHIGSRCVVCLDADYGNDGLWDDWELFAGYACVMHTTHSHTPDAPRFRFIVPLKRPVTAEEYSPIARRLASMVGIEAFDDTTYEANRLMFWPSVSSDGEFIAEECEGDWADPDDILASYTNWKDVSEWPVSSRQKKVIQRRCEKQGIPSEKPGIVGAFCRAYTISSAIDRYLPDVYTEAGPNRYTYIGGSTVGGAVVYDDDQFIFSHHDTDPISGREVNAFDLVRIHLFGNLDDGHEDESVMNLPSASEMKKLCSTDEAVIAELADGMRSDPEDMFPPTDGLERFADDLTEQGLAIEFADTFGQSLRFNKAYGWMLWNGVLWELDAEAEATMLAMRFFDERLIRAQKELAVAEDKEDQKRAASVLATIKRLRSSAGVKHVLELTKSILAEKDASSYDADPWILNTPGGTVELKTGAVREHRKDDKCTKVAAVSVGKGSSDRWKEFLEHITGGDEDFERYLQELVGMAAVGAVYEEGLVICHGPGGNGKSTLFGAVRAVLGDYARGINPELLVGKTDMSFVAALRGVRVAILSETEEGAYMSPAGMKRITSRDKIVARSLYKDPVEFSPSHTCIMHTNHLPKLGGTDGGTKRRIAVAPFTRVLPIERVDTDYERKLVRECGAEIMSWIVEGASRFWANGCKLNKPRVVQAATAEYLSSEDWLGMFLSDECYVEDKGSFTGVNDLFKVYHDRWCVDNGVTHPKAKVVFSRALQDRGYEATMRKIDGKVIRGFWGVSLKDFED